MQLISIMLICGAGGVLLGCASFGSGLVCVGFLPFILHSIPQSALISGAVALPSTTAMGLKQIKTVNWKVFVPICIIYIIMFPIMTFFSLRIDLTHASFLLGIVLVLLSAFFLFVGDRLKIPKTKLSLFIVGLISGFMGGFFNLSGVVMAIYFVNIIDNKEEYYATQAFFIFISDVFGFIIRIILKIMTIDLVWPVIVGAIGTLFGVMIGFKLRKIIKFAALKKIVYIVSGLFGVYRVIEFLFLK